MSENSLLQDEARSALRDGAARLDQFVQQVRAHQAALSQGTSGEQTLVLSPDEAWSRNFMSQAIGPRLEIPRIVGFTPPPMPQMSLYVTSLRHDSQPYAPRPAEEPGLRTVPSSDNSGPLSRTLGKDVPSRSWLARLFRRSA